MTLHPDIDPQILAGASPAEESLIHYLSGRTEQHGDLELPHAADYMTPQADAIRLTYLSQHHSTFLQQALDNVHNLADRYVEGSVSAIEQANLSIVENRVPGAEEERKHRWQQVYDAIEGQDVTSEAYERAAEVVMSFFLIGPNRITDLSTFIPEELDYHPRYGPQSSVSTIVDEYIENQACKQ